MARLAVIVAVTFFLFAFSHARSPLDFPENEVTVPSVRVPSNSVPEADAKKTTNTIFLPSEKLVMSEPLARFEWETVETDTIGNKPLESEVKPIESTETSMESDPIPEIEPLTIVSFRPINHHMHAKRPFPSRFPHRCRHHFKHGAPSLNSREVSYGNDMLMADEAVISDPMLQRGMPQIPARWVRFHHHGRPSFPHSHREWNNNEEDVQRQYHHHVEEGGEQKGREEREISGFMMRFRKFLNHF